MYRSRGDIASGGGGPFSAHNRARGRRSLGRACHVTWDSREWNDFRSAFARCDEPCPRVCMASSLCSRCGGAAGRSSVLGSVVCGRFSVACGGLVRACVKCSLWLRASGTKFNVSGSVTRTLNLPLAAARGVCASELTAFPLRPSITDGGDGRKKMREMRIVDSIRGVTADVARGAD